MRSLLLVGLLALAAGCGGDECEVDAGPFDCTLTVGVLSGDCGAIARGQPITWVYVVPETAERTCTTEQASVGPTWQAAQGFYFSYDGTMSAVSSTRLEGQANYRLGPNMSGPPECKLAGPLVCIHR